MNSVAKKLQTAKVVYTGNPPYQFFWKNKGYVLRTGEETPVELPIYECERLMRTGFFAASEGVWREIMSQGKNPDPAKLENSLVGRRVFIIGGGPSLKGFDLSKLDDEYTIAINHSFDYYPKAKMVLFVDTAYADFAKDQLKNYEGVILASFRCQDRLPKKQNIFIFPQNNSKPGKNIGEGLYTGKLSALCAINAALVMGASEIYLLGFDMNYRGKDHHWYGTAVANQDSYDVENLTKKIPLFDAFKPWADRIFNCSKSSSIKIFAYADLNEVLKNKGLVTKQSLPFSASLNTAVNSSIPTYPTSIPSKLQKINGMLKGKRVFVVGSGPSLKGFDLSRLDNEETIAVNHTLEHYSKAKYHLFGDPRVYDYVKPIYEKYKGLIFASYHANVSGEEKKNPNMFVFAKNWNYVTENIEDGLYSDFSSGMEAVNLALVMGAEKIYLLGMDFCANDGEYYFYGKPDWMTTPVEKCDKLFNKRVQYWDKFGAFRDRIFNCSKISRIKTFPVVDINEVLK